MNDVNFALNEIEIKKNKSKTYTILVVDDDIDTHKITKFILSDFDYRDYNLEFISAYSGKEAKEIIRNTPNIALILLDVVMETSNAGFDVVKYVREELNNNLIRIVMRTGQPGFAPEREIIIKYGINNYLEKTDSDSTRFFTAVVVAIRSYQDLVNLQKQNDIITYQSKMAAMGEMIEYISHQWKQPLSAIAGILSKLTYKNHLGKLTSTDISSYMNKLENIITYQAQTINDFKNFFISNKKENQFLINETFEKILNLLENQFKYENIHIVNNIQKITLFGLENELIQVILNILNNAKDELIKKDEKKRFIFLDTTEINEKVIISIKDTAGGIPLEFISKIFDSRFTSKDKNKASGLGLYMSKVIIEKHMKATLLVSNKEFEYQGDDYIGAEFKIILKTGENSI